MYKIDFDKINWQTPMTGIRHKISDQQQTRIRYVEYTKDMPPHWCEKGHIGYIIDGRFEIKFDKDTIKFKKGDGVFIPSGKEHKHMARAVSEVVKAFFVEEI